jgi:hypothetical protein
VRLRNTVLLALAGALAVAGCGSSDGEAPPTATSVTATQPTTGSSPAQPEATVSRFLQRPSAALLSPESRTRVSISLLRSRYSGLAGAKVGVSQRITDEFGVVAVTKGTRAAAFAMRLVGEKWLIELGGPLSIEPLGPRPGAREPVVAQIGAEVKGVHGSVTATMWLDRQSLDPKIYPGTASATVYASFDPPVERGRHVAVVFASTAADASALAWTFVVS